MDGLFSLLWVFSTCIASRASASSQFQLDRAASERAQAGKEQLDRIVGEGEAATRSCWSAAVEELKAGCRAMDDEQRSKLAVQFTNCHLEKSGLDQYACTREMSVASCTRPMVDSPSGLAYSAYTTFYTHAESMCYYLQSEAFQRATETAVDLLHSSARGTAQQLNQLHTQTSAVAAASETILAEQQLASAAAKELLEGQQAAAAELSSLRSSQAAAFAAAEHSLQTLGTLQHEQLSTLQGQAEAIGSKQQSLIGGLDRVLTLQQTLVGDMMDITSIVFYVCAVGLAFGLTATARTAPARLHLFTILSLNALLEKALAGYLLPLLGVSSHETLHLITLSLRRCSALLGGAVLVRAALRHVDLARRTLNSIDELKQLQKQSADELAAMLAKIEQKAAAARAACRVRDAAASRTRQALIIARRPSYSPARTLSPAALAPSRHPSPPVCATTTTGAPNERASRSPDGRPPVVRSPASPKGAELGDELGDEQTRAEASAPSPPPQRCPRPSAADTADAADALKAEASAPRPPARSRRSSVGQPTVEGASGSLTPTRSSARLAEKARQRESIG